MSGIAAAHPLGNFTINHYDGVRVATDSVLIDHVVDMAEIPTFRERAAMDTDGDGTVSPEETAAYLATACDTDATTLDLRLAGTALPLEVTQRGLTFPMGQGALTTRLVCVYRATLPVGLGATAEALFSFRVDADIDRIGWREIVVQGDGATITRSDAPATGVSQRLTQYPTDLLGDSRCADQRHLVGCRRGRLARGLRGARCAARRWQHDAPRPLPLMRPRRRSPVASPSWAPMSPRCSRHAS